MTSTRTSISGSRASATGSATQRNFFASKSRFLPRERALSATTSIARSQRTISFSLPSSSRRTTALPTVPTPARPTLSGIAITRRLAWGLTSWGKRRRLPSRRHRHDVVQHFRACFKKAPDIARRLADALLVFDKRDAHMALAVLAEAGSGRHRHPRLLDQERREFHAAERPERFGDRRPGEHRGGRRRHHPAGPAKGIDERVAPALIGRAHLVDALVGTVERRRRRHLDGREGAVIEIGFDAPERRDNALVADRKTDAPARHRIGL